MGSHSPNSQRALMKWGYVAFALFVLAASWEADLNAMALAAPAIPEEAIRIRILAHSDSPRDQWIKRRVRDAIAAEVSGWGLDGADAGQARAVIEAHLPALERIADQTLRRYGFAYGASAELAKKAFPAKTFEGVAYPAGEYETLLITLGAGRGENWWCVLFPPLCFGGGTVKAKPAERESAEPASAEAEQADAKAETADENRNPDGAGEPETPPEGKPAANAEGKAKGNNKKAARPAPDAGDGAEAGGTAGTDAAGDAPKNTGTIREGKAAEPHAGTAAQAADDVEVRFFFADLFRKAVGKIREWIA